MNAPAYFHAESLDMGNKADFPILSRLVHGKRLVYLDNGATTQKPQSVIEAERRFYQESNANIHRGVHWLSQHATDLYEQGRERVRQLLNAAQANEIVFTRGTTEAINLVAQSWACSKLSPGDEIILSGLEHHSNIVPWQLACERTGAKTKVIPLNDQGELDLQQYKQMLGPRVRLVAIAHISNALGTINPVTEMTRLAHDAGALVLVDGAQAVAHQPVDVQEIGCDFYAFSGHKLYGPTGIGALYGRYDLLQAMPPWQGGGDMIRTVSFERSTYADAPQRFEAGTPNIAGVVGLAAAIDYVLDIGLERIAAHEGALLDYGTKALQAVSGVRLIGTAADKAGILSFVVDGIHPHDLGTILDTDGVAIRAGHHCAMPVMTRFGIPGTARASLALYNNRDDIDALVKAIGAAQTMFGVER
ncbi:cysteine desulfurase [Eoetvoesiella caeni]|uniref:Cysteine desulfurase n=1 Tax=Eoetvoesiella caeni TaxID=645616 RepID=A0A366HFT5_9BURK|nr:cysteine desulfurase [Eoetvoesiella caeni]MCI2808738.1 cysteine desulfurase [Eoetvoesiella caeni]NYT55279.1 cysteine desulfurase [Eoetvoesiella caeni]RBP40739.1 cysteine desulfurase/selenocysteine lyase [Eoetvoesiella caeni]